MRRWIPTLFVLVSVISILSGCRPGSPAPSGGGSAQHTTLRLRWLPQSQFAGIYWAQAKGLFKREGLEVTVTPGGPGVNFMQLVGSGAEDFGICGAAQIIEGRDKGLPVVALALVFQGNPNIFFAKADKNIRSPRDWVGKRVAVFHGYDLEYMYHAILKRNGIKPGQVKEYPAKFDMTPFFRDEVDVWGGYVINQPNTAEEKGFRIVRFFPDDYGVHVSGDCLFTTEKIAREKPELCQKMVNAFLDGWHQALQHKDETLNLMLAQDSKLNRVHEQKMIDSVERLTLTPEIKGKIGWMTREQWQGMIGLWKEFAGIKKDTKPDECFDLRFTEKYYQSHPAK